MNGTNRKLIKISLRQSREANHFIRVIKENRIPMFDIRFQKNSMTFQVYLNDLPKLRKMRRVCHVKFTVQYATPNKIIQKDLSTLFGLLVLAVIPIILSQFIWKIDVEANTIEIEDRVAHYLHNEMDIQYPIRRSAFYSDNTLRQQLMEHFREFSWIHITKMGSHVTIAPQLAPKIEQIEKANEKQHLIASNSGVITHFEIERGIRKVEQNMTVYRGDTLVSGVLVRDEDVFVVGAAGEVYADYWLETTFSIPKKIEIEVLDDYGWEYTVDWGQIAASWEQKSIEPLKYFIQYLPYRMLHKKTEKINEDDIENFILPLLHEKMLRSLPLKSTIKSEKLLHVYADDDTVKGKVLYLVNENIAKPHPIHQGE